MSPHTSVAGDAAVVRLLASSEPAVVPDDAPRPARRGRTRPRRARRADRQYKKWQGAHWRLVSLAALEIPPSRRLRSVRGALHAPPGALARARAVVHSGRR